MNCSCLFGAIALLAKMKSCSFKHYTMLPLITSTSTRTFDLVHQTVSPCVRVGSGDKTAEVLSCVQINENSNATISAH